LLAVKCNLILAVTSSSYNKNIIAFYTTKPKCLNGGVIMFYDLNALPRAQRLAAEDTFTNWVAQKYLLYNNERGTESRRAA